MRNAFAVASLALAGSIALLPSSLLAACDLEISSVDQVTLEGGDSYDVFAVSGLADRLRVEIRRSDSTRDPVPSAAEYTMRESAVSLLSTPSVDNVVPTTRCHALITLQGGVNPTLVRGSSQLRYQLQPASRRAVSRHGSISLVVTDLPPGGTAELLYDLVVPAEQFVPGGFYTGDMLATVVQWRGESPGIQLDPPGANADVDDRRRIDVSVEVDGAARISFAGTQGRQRIVDFGQLKSGATPVMPVALIIQASSSYALRFRSDNGGQLQQRSGGRDWNVPYALRIGRDVVDLQSGESQIVRTDPTSSRGHRVPLDFRVLNAEDRPAGRYSDRLTIEITPAELGW